MSKFNTNKKNKPQNLSTVHVQKCWHQKCCQIHPMFKCVDTFSGLWNRNLYFFCILLRELLRNTKFLTGRLQRKWFGQNSSKKIWICHRNVRQKLSSTVVIWHPSGPGMPRYCNLTPKTGNDILTLWDTWRTKYGYQIDQWFKVRVLGGVPSRYRKYFRF